MESYSELLRHAPKLRKMGVKILGRIGSGETANNFMRISESATLRVKYAASIIDVMEQLQLDGLYLQWMYPGCPIVRHSSIPYGGLWMAARKTQLSAQVCTRNKSNDSEAFKIKYRGYNYKTYSKNKYMQWPYAMQLCLYCILMPVTEQYSSSIHVQSKCFSCWKAIFIFPHQWIYDACVNSHSKFAFTSKLQCRYWKSAASNIFLTILATQLDQ